MSIYTIHCFEGKEAQQRLLCEAKLLGIKCTIPFGSSNEYSVKLWIPKGCSKHESRTAHCFIQRLEMDERYSVFYPNSDRRSFPDRFEPLHRVSPINVNELKSKKTEDTTPKTQEEDQMNVSAYTAKDLKTIYSFPAPFTVSPRVNIAIISLGGFFQLSDIQYYWTTVCGYQAPLPSVTVVRVNGTAYVYGQDGGADLENTLDLEVAGGTFPGCNLVFYSAPNTITGFYNAISMATLSTTRPPVAISISWGAPETAFGASNVRAISQICGTAASKGINITVASGDRGSSDGIGNPLTSKNVDFPSASPNVIACGGTTLVNGNTASETAWSWNPQYLWGTGGGISTVFASPLYQRDLTPAGLTQAVRNRAVPDLSAVADPFTPVIIYGGGQLLGVGGTSCVAPLVAGLLATINPKVFVNTTLYQNRNNNVQTPTSWFRNISIGQNPAYICAPSKYSCVCGIGSFNGVKMNALFHRLETKAENKADSLTSVNKSETTSSLKKSPTTSSVEESEPTTSVEKSELPTSVEKSEPTTETETTGYLAKSWDYIKSSACSTFV